MEQSGVELAFELFQPAGDRGRVHVKRPGGTAYGSRPGESLEQAEVIPVEVGHGESGSAISKTAVSVREEYRCNTVLHHGALQQALLKVTSLPVSFPPLVGCVETSQVSPAYTSFEQRPARASARAGRCSMIEKRRHARAAGSPSNAYDEGSSSSVRCRNAKARAHMNARCELSAAPACPPSMFS